jgi:hypothetical protein
MADNERNADYPPVVPVGWTLIAGGDWPQQRIGVRAHLRSTYDRTGHNRTADASHYLYQLAEDFNVTLDVEGAGVLYFVRTNRWHGSPWHYEIDGVDHIVTETTTADPLVPLPDSVFQPEAAFPHPLTYTYATTHGADLNWVPMAFTQRLRLAYARTFYGTGYYIYQQFVRARASVSRLCMGCARRSAVLALLASSGSDIAAGIGAAREQSGSVDFAPEAASAFWKCAMAPRCCAGCLGAGSARSSSAVRGDDHVGRPTLPSIDAPLDLFFGAGALRDPGGEWLVKHCRWRSASTRATSSSIVISQCRTSAVRESN